MGHRAGIFFSRVLSGLLLWFLIATSTDAEESGSLDFDLYRTDSNLVIWIDFSSLLTSRRVEGLREGVDLQVDYNVRLVQPRRLWGERAVVEESGSFELNYRLITDRFEWNPSDSADSLLHSFSSLAKLHRFLADSILISIALNDRINNHNRYCLTLNAACISMTTFNLPESSDPASSGSSPLRFLFASFLELTGYGRSDFSTRSEPFKISDLPTKE
ncbi:MAG TPA: DUF4390 domain-containing protein [candidate division Zixibacteria bacterium]|nr:DUF4390 domain-containing protein [candidate division Zixibacteria bacterium]